MLHQDLYLTYCTAVYIIQNINDERIQIEGVDVQEWWQPGDVIVQAPTYVLWPETESDSLSVLLGVLQGR